MTVTQPSHAPPLAVLARKEIGHYLHNKLFWVGAGLLILVSVIGLVGPDPRYSTTGDGLAPAALIGVLGIVVMAGMTRNSDRAAAAAGAPGVGQRTRTLALACAVVVPFTVGLLWYAAAIVGYHLHPPAASAVPFGPVTDTFVYAAMFVEGVTACVGGPLLGLVIGRWAPRRGVAPVVSVLLVLGTMIMQPLFDFNERWREIWPWVHFYGAGGTDEDPDATIVHTGSPYLYIGYLAALCVLGVLVAMYRDDEADRSGLRKAILVVVGVAVVLCALTMMGGLDEVLVNPVPSSVK
jgi:hypothetical protein